MSFDVFLLHFHEGDAAPADKRAFLQVLSKYGYDGNDGDGLHNISLPDRTPVELNVSGLDTDDEPFTGCGFHLRGLSLHVAQLIFDVAVAADMVIFAASEDGSAILVNEAQLAHLPKNLDIPPITCASARHLEEIMAGPHSAWSDYRDQISRRAGGRSKDA
jgi:hypothetical protein